MDILISSNLERLLYHLSGNNGTEIKKLMEQLEQKRFLSELQIGYLAECRPGELLVLESGQQGENLYIRGVDEEGKARFESELQFGQVIP